MEELVEKVKVLVLNVDAGVKRLDVPGKESELKTLHSQQETLALASKFKELETVARKIKKLEQSLFPWQKLYKDSQALADLFELVSAEDKDMQTELATTVGTLEQTYARLHLLSLFSDPLDTHNAYLSIHAGAGGTEACDWAEILERMYVRFCERRQFGVSLVDLLRDAEAGIKSATLHVKGVHAYGYLKAEVGVHRLVRISPFDSGKRRHTSFASVSVIPELDDTLDITIEPSEVRVDTFRASGAGGQHVNTTDSAVRLTHLPSGIVVSCQVERSQYQNKEQAFKILKARLYEKKREEQLRATKESQKTQKKIEWGSQIRSYILHPYQMIKDHRTGYETGDVKRVMDGKLDDFIEAFLKAQS